MSWLERISVQPAEGEEPQSMYEEMSPGLTGQIDQGLREKAAMHEPPVPPENMGLEGEFDPAGLVKRIAIALDHDPMIEDIQTLTLVQIGSSIVLRGDIDDADTLTRIVQRASQVDGTKVVDTHQVSIQ